MVAQALKERTAHLHDTIENVTRSKKIFDGTFTVEDYKNLLHINGYIVNSFIDNIFNALPEDITSRLKFTAASKKAAIARDAQELDMVIDETPVALVENNPAYALGALYVMEGSMLGGNVIAKNLKKHEAFAGHKFHYFTFYKDMLGSNWKDFLGTLSGTVRDEADIESSVKGATQVYDALIAKARTLFS